MVDFIWGLNHKKVLTKKKSHWEVYIFNWIYDEKYFWIKISHGLGLSFKWLKIFFNKRNGMFSGWFGSWKKDPLFFYWSKDSLLFFLVWKASLLLTTNCRWAIFFCSWLGYDSNTHTLALPQGGSGQSPKILIRNEWKRDNHDKKNRER